MSNESCIDIQLCYCAAGLTHFPSLTVYLACYHTHIRATWWGMQEWNWLTNPSFLKKVGLNPQWPRAALSQQERRPVRLITTAVQMSAE